MNDFLRNTPPGVDFKEGSVYNLEDPSGLHTVINDRRARKRRNRISVNKHNSQAVILF